MVFALMATNYLGISFGNFEISTKSVIVKSNTKMNGDHSFYVYTYSKVQKNLLLPIE